MVESSEELKQLARDIAEIKELFGQSTQSLYTVVRTLAEVGQAAIKLGRMVVIGFLLVIVALVSKAVYVELNFPFGSLHSRHEETIKALPSTLTERSETPQAVNKE